MAKNKQPLKLNSEEGSQGTNKISDEPKLISDQEKEPKNETGSGPINFRFVKAMTASDRSGSYSQSPCLWPYSDDNKYCCIYRVPCALRRVNPEAYTPQMLLIGPLHHSKKAQIDKLSETDLRYLHYKKMEQHKKKYLDNIAHNYGNQTVEEFKRIIKRDEQIIRACYAESTDSINSEEFVEMILHDSVFILVFFMHLGPRYIEKTGDFLLDEPCYQYTVFDDLTLLENQLPYALLESLFEPFFAKHGPTITFRDLILQGFDLEEDIKRDLIFLHFTDMCRLVRVETLGLTKEEQTNENFVRKEVITSLHNADKLDGAGVKFVASKYVGSKEQIASLVIKFEDGILEMPYFIAEDDTEKVLRNIMALEQCHYPYTTFVCDYIIFLDYLIDTERDVDLLVDKGIIENCLGHQKSVIKMMNKLCLEIEDNGSYYYGIAESLNNHYKSRLNRSIATLRRVYFKDIWTGTATLTAVVLLVLTLIGTVASVLQVTQKDDNPKH